jgi:hypothetical protein
VAYVAPSATTNIQGSIEAGARPTPIQQFVLDSVASTGRVTSPVAGQSITFVVVPKTGKYSCQITVGLGNRAGTAPNNVQVLAGADVVTSLTLVQIANTLTTYTLVLTLGATALQLQAINTDAGEYIGTLICTAMSATG